MHAMDAPDVYSSVLKFASLFAAEINERMIRTTNIIVIEGRM